MKKEIFAALLIVLFLVAAVFAQGLMQNDQAAGMILNRNKSLEARVAALEAKVARLEKMIQDPPARIIPCDAE